MKSLKAFNLVKFEIFSLQLYYKPITLLDVNSFTSVVQVFYPLFRNRPLRNITWWLLPLFVNCEILNIEKTIEQEKQLPGGVL